MTPVAAKKTPAEELFSELARIGAEAERRKFLDRHRAMVKHEVVRQLSELVVERARVNTEDALRLAEAALSIGRRLRGKEEIALGLRAKANALYVSGDNRAAVEEFVRRRDIDRLALQQAEGISAGLDLLRTRMVHEPLSTPRREVKLLNPEAEKVIARLPPGE